MKIAKEKLGTLLFSLVYMLYGVWYMAYVIVRCGGGGGTEIVLANRLSIVWQLTAASLGLGSWGNALDASWPRTISVHGARSLLVARLALVIKIAAWGKSRKKSTVNFRFEHFICT